MILDYASEPWEPYTTSEIFENQIGYSLIFYNF